MPALTRDAAARAWFALTALAAFTGLVVQAIVTATGPGVLFDDPGARLFNMLCYFTVQTNLIVAVTTLLLALRLDRRSIAFRVFRLSGLVAIAVTGVVFEVALESLRELEGSAAAADALLHTVSPIMCVLGWLVFGPRGMITSRVVALAVIYPLCWSIFTLIRGPIVEYYPYPFVDVDDLGYARVVLNIAIVGVFFVALAAGAAALDRLLSRRATGGGRSARPRSARA